MSCRAGKKFPEMFISTGFHTSAFLFFLGPKKRKNHDEMIFSCVGLSEKVLTGEKTIRKANIS